MTGPARFQPSSGPSVITETDDYQRSRLVSFEVGRDDDKSYGKRSARKMDAPLFAKSSSYLCSIRTIALSTRPSIEKSFRASGITAER